MPWYAAAIIIALILLSAWLYADLRTTREERAGFMKTAGKEFKEAQRLARELAAQQALADNLTATIRRLRAEDGANAQTLEDYRKQLVDAQRERDAARAELAEVKKRAALVLRQWAECVEVGGWPPSVA